MIVQDEISLTKVKNGVDGGDGKDGTNGKDGENGKDSNTYTAYSWSADGSDRFTDKYPNENFLLGTQEVYKMENATENKSQYKEFKDSINAESVSGKTVICSMEIDVKKAKSRIDNNQCRIGWEIMLTRKNGQYVYLGVWRNFIEGESFKGRVSVRFILPDDIITVNNKGARYMQMNGEFLSIHECKLEVEPSATPTIYTPSPKDDFNNAWPTFIGTYSSHEKVQSQNPKDYTWARILGESGKDGTNGKDGQTPKDVISGYLSNEAIIVPATPTGNVTDYSKAFGDFIVSEGQTKLVNGVTYSKVSEVNMTSTINSAGRYAVTALSADTGTATYRATYAGVTVDKILIVVKNKQGPSGANGEKGDKGDKGDKGAIGNTGPKGDPTGITVSPTVPTNPYINMLWQNTGSNNGYLTGTVYQWNGAKWNIFIFSAENIVATTLSAISANLGNITAGNIKGATIEGTNIIGSTVETRASKVYPDLGAILYWSKLTDALRISGSAGQNRPTYETTYQLDGMSGFGSGPTGAGKDSEWDFGLNGLSYKTGGVTGIGKASYDFTSRGFNIDVGNFTVNDKELSTNGPTRLSPASGFSVYSTSEENEPRARRFGKTVTLSGAFTNNNNLAKGWSGVIGYLPGWATPSVMHRALCQGSGSNTFYLQVKPNGELFLERYGTNDTVAFNSGAWLTINTTYLI
ncbi:hypothetical protein P7H75_05910 [Vagococcus carniphilus]|uniref:hypothetical protein n=1 Tax=Vagococcus carniphilus TaxID=218144 RepID=UPI00288F9D5F|nr:hypothetical protein [Vagococcus carniphilus]MDT2814375.1 hypothetical protein [Vagococcus carniphilus]